MAGIGFELRRVIQKGGLANVFNATLSGVMIVAGPWLLTTVTLFLIRLSLDQLGIRHSALFQSAIIYSYALSLPLGSGLHYLFTRMIADLLWLNQAREAAGWLLRFLVATLVGSLLVGTGAMAWFDLGSLEDAWLFRAGAVLLFTAINLLWLVMLFISLLRWYVQIMLVYVLGMAAAIGLVWLWGHAGGIGGALLGFGCGHLLIVAALVLMSFKAYPPRLSERPWATLFHILKRNRVLILSGMAFYLGQWVDKFFFWLTRGASVEGSAFRLFNDYDLPVYFAGLSIIPGLVYFVIVSETSFYQALQRFMHALSHQPYHHIQAAKQDMIRVLRRELRDQNLFQGLFSLLAFFLVWWFIPDPAMRQTAALIIAASFFLLMLMTLLNFLYYFELYGRALWGAACFLAMNALVFPLVYLYWPGFPLGAGYLVSLACGAALSFVLLQTALGSMDRRILLKAMIDPAQ